MTENLNEFSERLDGDEPVESGLNVGQPGLALPRPLLHLSPGPILDCKRRELSRAAAGGGRMAVEMSPVGQSASNGVVERAIQSVVGQARVVKSALEARLGVKLPAKHPVLP